MRRPRKLTFDDDGYSVAVTTDGPVIGKPYAFYRLYSGHGYSITPSEARRLAGWLLRFAEWAEWADEQGKEKR